MPTSCDKRDADTAARADEVLAPKSRERSSKDDVRGRIEDPEKKPHFLDPDYEGPSKEEIDHAARSKGRSVFTRHGKRGKRHKRFG